MPRYHCTEQKKRILLNLNIFQSNFLAIWALFGAATGLYLSLLQLLIPALTPLSLSRKEKVKKSVLDPFLGDHTIRMEKFHMVEDGPKRKGGGWHDHNVFHFMVLILDRRSQ